jgi:hypothetical protein
MIRMKALKPFGVANGPEGHVRRGREFTVEHEGRARDLEAAGLAYRLQTKAEPPPQNKMEPPAENKAAHSGPLPSAGGETGAAEPVPSSPPDRRRRGRRWRPSADE